jgi:hypothetical protein
LHGIVIEKIYRENSIQKYEVLVVFRHPSEKYEFVKVSWDYDIPNMMGKITK